MKKSRTGYWTGKKRSEETRRKISETLSGRKRTLSKDGKRKMMQKLSGKNNYNWKGGKPITREGYVLVKAYNHPHANSSHYVLEHRIKMENHLRKHKPNSRFLVTINGKKYLDKSVNVHHIDRNKSNNHISNLVCIYGRDHIKIHDPLSYRYGKKTNFKK